VSLPLRRDLTTEAPPAKVSVSAVLPTGAGGDRFALALIEGTLANSHNTAARRRKEEE